MLFLGGVVGVEFGFVGFVGFGLGIGVGWVGLLGEVGVFGLVVFGVCFGKVLGLEVGVFFCFFVGV